MKKGRKKYLEGSTIHNYIEDPTKAIYDNNLMIDQALIQASQDTELMRTIGDGLMGMSTQLPGAVEGFKKTFGMATGGKVSEKGSKDFWGIKDGKYTDDYKKAVFGLLSNKEDFNKAMQYMVNNNVPYATDKDSLLKASFDGKVGPVHKYFVDTLKDGNNTSQKSDRFKDVGVREGYIRGKKYLGTPEELSNKLGEDYESKADTTGYFEVVDPLYIDNKTSEKISHAEMLKRLQEDKISPDKMQSTKKGFATGGRVPVEIEGQEVVETPEGQMFQAQGPSHEQGGIDMNLPEGTDVYSKRIQIDGKSMADRKLAREREEKKWVKRSKYDAVSKNTLNRIQAKNQMEEMFDMNIMQAAFNAKNERQEFGTGGSIVDYLANAKQPYDFASRKKLAEDKGITNYTGTSDQNIKLLGLLTGANSNTNLSMNPGESFFDASKRAMSNVGPEAVFGELPKTPIVEKNATPPKPILNYNTLTNTDEYKAEKGYISPMVKYGDKEENYKRYNTPGTDPEKASSQSPYTPGDLLGMLGNAYQAYTNKASANAEIATDQPNINPYEGFGEDALNANSEAMKYIGQMRDNALRNASLEANSAQKRGRRMSRSANTARAMDISISGNKNIADSKIQDAFAQQMMALFGQKSQLENQQDSYTMQGREKQDINDRMDKAARFATSRDADMSIGKAISGIGANMNTAKGRGATEKLINSMSMYGKYNWQTGELSADTGGIERMLQDGTWKNATDSTGKPASTPEEFRIMAKKGKLTIKAI